MNPKKAMKKALHQTTRVKTSMNVKLIMAIVTLTNTNVSIMMAVLNVIVLMVLLLLSPARMTTFDNAKISTNVLSHHSIQSARKTYHSASTVLEALYANVMTDSKVIIAQIWTSVNLVLRIALDMLSVKTQKEAMNANVLMDFKVMV